MTETPRKICLVGFAGSKVEAPFADPTWEIWGVNDLYAHVPRVDRTFEVHDMQGLLENGRRNPQYIEWLKKGKHPVYMTDPRPEFPSAVRFPYEAMLEMFPRRYFTNSVSWMLALAIAELTDLVELPDGRKKRISRPGCEVSMFGIHMAAESEYEAQRPSCEYFIGVADGAGLPLYLPDTSDLCKAASLYGIDTTAPLRKTLEMKIAEATQQSQAIDQQMAQLDAQRQNLLYQKGVAQGSKSMAKYLRQNWTMPTDIVKPPEPGMDRHGEPVVAPSSAHSDNVQNQSNGKTDIPIDVVVGGN